MKVSKLFLILWCFISFVYVVFPMKTTIYFFVAFTFLLFYIIIGSLENKIKKNIETVEMFFFFSFNKLNEKYIIKESTNNLQVYSTYNIPILLVDIKIGISSVKINFKDGWAKNVSLIFKIKNLSEEKFDYFLFGQLDQIMKEG